MFRWLKKKYQKNNEPSKSTTCRRLSFPDLLDHKFHFENLKQLEDEQYQSYSNLSTDFSFEHIYAEIDDRASFSEASQSSRTELSLVDIVDDGYEEFNSVPASPFRAAADEDADEDDGYLIPLKTCSSGSDEDAQEFPTYFVVTPEREFVKETVSNSIIRSMSSSDRKMQLRKRKEVKSWHGRIDPISSEDDQWEDVTNEFVFQLDTVATVERTPSKLSNFSRKMLFWNKHRGGGLSTKESVTSKKKCKSRGYSKRTGSSGSIGSLSDLSDDTYYCEIRTIPETASVFQEMPYFNPKFGFGLNKWYNS